jgi:broad specificity phosphatase PhoE
MPTTVLLIRHPESDWNRKGIYQGRRDTPLSPLGLAQAQLVAARLRREPIQGVISSPLRRALVLARAIARSHHLTPDQDHRLIELSHGIWEGMPRAEVERRFPEMSEAWRERPHEVTFPGGESLLDVHRRSMPLISDLLARPGDETWVVVTHDVIARLAVAAAQGRPIKGFGSVSLENAAITTLQGPGLLGSVQHLNDVRHLGPRRVALEGQAL